MRTERYMMPSSEQKRVLLFFLKGIVSEIFPPPRKWASSSYIELHIYIYEQAGMNKNLWNSMVMYRKKQIETSLFILPSSPLLPSCYMSLQNEQPIWSHPSLPGLQEGTSYLQKVFVREELVDIWHRDYRIQTFLPPPSSFSPLESLENESRLREKLGILE